MGGETESSTHSRRSNVQKRAHLHNAVRIQRLIFLPAAVILSQWKSIPRLGEIWRGDNFIYRSIGILAAGNLRAVEDISREVGREACFGLHHLT